MRSVICVVLLSFLFGCSVGKHTLFVDNVQSSATNTVVLRDVTSDVFTVNEADLQFINLNLQGDSSLVLDTAGGVSFDGGFIGFDSGSYVNITAGLNGRLSTAETVSLSGDELNFESLRFLLATGGDLDINTDSSIRGNANRVGINSLAHTDLRVAQGPMEFLAAENLDIYGRRTEIVGDDRISLYSFDTLSVNVVNDFQSYAAFIDFDSVGDIRLTTQTGNIHMDSVRDVIFEAENIDITAPVGVDIQSEHGEIHVDVADNFKGTSDDIIFIETVDELRYLADNEFTISTVDLAMTSSQSTTFRARTLESVFRTASLQSHTTEITTGGDILMLLNGASQSAYSFEGSNRIAFESRNVQGDVSSLSFDVDNAGDIEIASENEFDSSFTLTTNDLTIDANDDVFFSSSAVRMTSPTFSYTAGDDIDIRADSAIGDSARFAAQQAITLQSKNLVGEGEFGVWFADDDLDFNANDNFEATAGPQADEEFLLRGETRVNVLSQGSITQTAQLGVSTFDITDFSLRSTGGDINVKSQDDMILYSDETFTMEGTDVNWFLDEASFEAADITLTADNDVSINAISAVSLYASGSGTFTSPIFAVLAADYNVNAFEDINIDDLLQLIAEETLRFESGESATFTASNGIEFFNTDSLFIRSNNRYDLTYNGNDVIVEADQSVDFTSGFVTMKATDRLFVEASQFSIDTQLEENVNFISRDDILVNMQSGENFAKSDDDIRANQADINIRSSDTLRFTASEDFFAHIYSETEFFTDQSALFTSAEDFSMNSLLEIFMSSNDQTFTNARTFTVDFEGDITLSTSRGDLTFQAANLFEIRQEAGPASEDNISFDASNISILIDESYTQTGGSVEFQVAGDLEQLSSERILVASTLSSSFNVLDAVTFDATNPNGDIRIEAEDLDSNSVNSIDFTGGQINIASAESEYIEFQSTGGSVSLRSSAGSPITWDAAREWNATALDGIRVTANWPTRTDDPLGIFLSSTHPVMSEMFFSTESLQNGGSTPSIEMISKDSQTFSAAKIEFTASGDISYTNFFPPMEVGGVLFTTNGAVHDGFYEDKTAITARTSSSDSDILFTAPLGFASIDSGEDISHISENGRSFWTAKTDITFRASEGDIDINSQKGDVLFQSDKSSVLFNTFLGSTHLQASQSVDVTAGQAISLVSTHPIEPLRQNSLSFEFQAYEGNIVTRAVVQQPIFFEGNDFDLSSGEDTFFLANDNLPFVTNTGGFLSDSNTGIYLRVDGGDLDMVASDNILVSSAKNWDIRVESGEDTTWTAQTGSIETTAGKDSIIRTSGEDILFQTHDVDGDIFVLSEGEIRFQTDGTDIGQDGIFVDAPQIQSFAADDTVFDAESLFTVGANTRPIITLEAGGDAANAAVTMNSEGNINMEIGANFIISSQGFVKMTTQRDLDFQANGGISIESKGTQPLGRNVIFETQQKMDVRANDIEMTGDRRVSVLSDEFISVNTRTIFTLDVLNNLHTKVDEIYDINGEVWNWTSEDSFSMNTKGNIFISNNGAGSISIYGDSELSFLSDTNSKFVSEGDSADIRIETENSNSNIIVTTRSDLSDILFETLGSLSMNSVNELTVSTTGAIQITSPLDTLYDSSTSDITLTSAEDIDFFSDRSVVFQSDGAMTVSASAPAGADMVLSVLGEMNIQSWQNAVFQSISDSLSFSADFNITFVTEEAEDGFILLSSTRDIDITANGDLFQHVGGDFMVTAGDTFEIITTSPSRTALSFTTTGSNSNIEFTSQGAVDIDSDGSLSVSAGDTFFTSEMGATTLNVEQRLEIYTTGTHSDILIESQQGVLTTTAETSISFFARPSTHSSTLGDEAKSSPSGFGFINFNSKGDNLVDVYSTQFNAGERFNLRIPAGYCNFWSAETLDITSVTQTIAAEAETAIFVQALTPGGNIRIDTDNTQLSSIRYTDFTAEEAITIFPFDDLTFTARGSSFETEYADMLLQTNHPSADLLMFTTDFLTADMIFTASGAISTVSHESTTFLLLDDDDTATPGEFQITAILSISAAAENDMIIRETASGDIDFIDDNGQFYFTAGNDLTITARELLAITSNDLNISPERDFSIESPDDISITAATQDYRIDNDLRINSDTSFTLDSPNIEFNVFSDVSDITGSPNRELVITSGANINFNADTLTTITAGTNRIVDFRDNLKIPTTTDTIVTGDACGTPNEFFYSFGSNSFCYCVNAQYLCLQTVSLVP